MVNLTLTSLTVANSIIHSPLLTFSQRSLTSSYFAQKINVKKLSNSFLFGICCNKYKIQSSNFKSVLNSAISISNTEAYNEKRISKQILIRKESSLEINKCTFANCVSKRGGAVNARNTLLSVTDTIFRDCSAGVGGAVHSIYLTNVEYKRINFVNNTANYSAASHTDCDTLTANTCVDLVNTTRNSAVYWSGGLRMDRAGGSLSNCYFESNTALASGAFFDFAYKEARRSVTFNFYYNNSAEVRAGAYTCFHVMHHSEFNNCIFIKNFCKEQAYSISLESVNQEVNISNCFFDGPQRKQVSIRFDDSVLNIDSSNVFDNKLTSKHSFAKKILDMFSPIPEIQ